MKKQPLRGATVVITGASSGIGRATAHVFARQQANLVLVARREEALDDVAGECVSRGGRAAAVVADVTNARAMQHVAEVAVQHFGGIDVWVNNAGVGAVGEFNDVPIEAHDQVIQTNLMGYLHGAYAALPYFRRQQQGVLINVISLGAWVPAPYVVSYNASKFGLRGYSESLRAELIDAPGIHVCDVFPAFIDTPAFRHCGNYVGRTIQPPPPTYDPYDVANAIVSLAHSPRPAVTVGQAATVARVAYALFPALMRRGIKRMMDRKLQKAPVRPIDHGNLFRPPSDPATVRGGKLPSAGAQQQLLQGGPLLAGLALGVLLATRR
jgi:short-subunit dehydrogenase